MSSSNDFKKNACGTVETTANAQFSKLHSQYSRSAYPVIYKVIPRQMNAVLVAKTNVHNKLTTQFIAMCVMMYVSECSWESVCASIPTYAVSLLPMVYL